MWKIETIKSKSMKKLFEYTNGNYQVTILEDGTKIRQTEMDEFIPEFPESIDVKITNYCDAGCSFCLVEGTEISTPNGAVDIKNIKHNDSVYGFQDGVQIIDTVGELYSRYIDETIIHIHLEDNSIIKITKNHEVLTLRGWILAGDLAITDELIDVKI